MGIDERGGDAAGFVSILNARYNIGRKLGHWINAKESFLARAAVGHSTMLHARFATCGDKTVDEAHPFEITRPTHTILGMHNGVIHDAFESAEMNGRKIKVDSQEIFELVADGDHEGIQNMMGYGVITWTDTRYPDVIRLAKLTYCGDIEVVAPYGGGLIWGSTKSIVNDALDYVSMKRKCTFEIETGRVYEITPEGFFETEIDDLLLADWSRPTYAKRMSEAWDDAMKRDFGLDASEYTTEDYERLTK